MGRKKRIIYQSISSSENTENKKRMNNLLFSYENIIGKNKPIDSFFESAYYPSLYSASAILDSKIISNQYLELIQKIRGQKRWDSSKQLLELQNYNIKKNIKKFIIEKRLINVKIEDRIPEINVDIQQPSVNNITGLKRLDNQDVFNDKIKKHLLELLSFGFNYTISAGEEHIHIDIIHKEDFDVEGKLFENLENNLSNFLKILVSLYKTISKKINFNIRFQLKKGFQLIFNHNLIIPNYDNSKLEIRFEFKNKYLEKNLVNLNNISNFSNRGLIINLLGEFEFIGSPDGDIITSDHTVINPRGGSDTIYLTSKNETSTIVMNNSGTLNVSNLNDQFYEDIYLYNATSDSFIFTNQDENDTIYYTGDITFTGETSNIYPISWNNMENNIPDDIIDI